MNTTDLFYKGGVSLVKLNVSNEVMKRAEVMNFTSKYSISFPLSQSSSLPFIPEVDLLCNDIAGTLTKQDLEKDRRIIQDFNTKLKNQVKERIITNEDFLYGFCINVTIHLEKESDIIYGEDTFLNDFKTSPELMFFDNVKAQVKKYHSNNT